MGILVSIYNSMADRRHEIAVMRALGAGRSTVMRVVLAESIILSLAGGLGGWILGHGMIGGLSSWIEQRTGVWIGFFKFAPAPDLKLGEVVIPLLSYELILIPALILMATFVGFLPSNSESKNPITVCS